MVVAAPFAAAPLAGGTFYALGALSVPPLSNTSAFSCFTLDQGWSRLPNAPLARFRWVCTALDRLVYAVATAEVYRENANSKPCIVAANNMLVYHPVQRAWSDGVPGAAPLPRPGAFHYGGALGALGSALYLAGGVLEDEGGGDMEERNVRVVERWERGGDWTAVQPMRIARSDFHLLALDGLLYAVGGVVAFKDHPTRVPAWCTGHPFQTPSVERFGNKNMRARPQLRGGGKREGKGAEKKIALTPPPSPPPR